MRKKILVVMLIVGMFMIPALSFAGSDDVNWDSYLRPGNFIMQAGVGWGWGWNAWYSGFGVYGGAEMIMAEYKIADIIPLEFGAAAKGAVTFGVFGMGINAGALATAHLSFKGLNLPFDYLDNLDVYIGLGLGMTLDMSSYATVPFQLGLASSSGASYFLNDNLAIYLEETYFANFWASSLGVLLKL